MAKIQTVCGFGCGSSLMLRMNIEAIAKKHNVAIEAFCGDVGSCLANECDVIFISKELAENSRVLVNVKVAKPAKEVNIGDVIEIVYGNRVLKVKVKDIKDVVKKNDATVLYEVLDEYYIQQD